ncbi:putative Transcriptional regulator [Sterolibacterium denitrificans]|uniref:Transcriptional regulator n=1 Tax=Sterolibacterium denitrificans TaxID=157592 RepID=A0A7Z7HSZ2_9PROT|nr:GntR family transcriptional regulator [Sterolibacterium denitrificans]SMB31501.1 putative Transcriptional regulator [Sterolibacterium denitrificans]
MNQESNTEILRPRMLYEALADSLRKRIFSHELAPGAPLDEFKLASGYGVSRAPLREALKVLAGEGLVESRARQGCFVTRLSWSNVLQLLDLLDLLEDFAADEAARAKSCLSIDTREKLHASLVKVAGNACLPDLADRLIARLRLAFGPVFDSPEMQASHDFHEALKSAIAAGDCAETRHLLAGWSERRRQAGQAAWGRIGSVAPAKTIHQPGTGTTGTDNAEDAFYAGAV